GERAVTFRPAEVDLLFPGPFSRRGLLAYKVVAGFGTTLITAVFLTLAMRRHAALTLAAFVGLVLALEFMQLFAMSLSLTASALGAQAFNRRRKLLLTVVAF